MGVNRECKSSLYKVKVLVTQLCLTLCDPMDPREPTRLLCPWILQAGILEWVAISFSTDVLNPGIKPRSPALQADSLPSEPQGKAEGQNSWNFKGQSGRWRKSSELKGRKTQEEFFPYNPDKNNRYLDQDKSKSRSLTFASHFHHPLGSVSSFHIFSFFPIGKGREKH